MSASARLARWENVRWHGWEALRLENGACEMIVGCSAGPRILSLRWRGGPNLLHRDLSGFRVGGWRFFGGHRVSLAPEGPASYQPDNHRCRTECDGEGALMVEEPPEAGRMQRGLSINPLPDGSGFQVENRVRNLSGRPWRGSLWAITAVEPQGVVVSPCRLPSAAIRRWPENDPRANEAWELRAGHVVSAPRNYRGKAGWFSAEGWLAQLREDVTFLIQTADPAGGRPPVDEGCNVEVFVCSTYMEMETLGPEIILPAGGVSTHRQEWRLFPGGMTPSEWNQLDLLSKRTPTFTGQSL